MQPIRRGNGPRIYGLSDSPRANTGIDVSVLPAYASHSRVVQFTHILDNCSQARGRLRKHALAGNLGDSPVSTC